MNHEQVLDLITDLGPIYWIPFVVGAGLSLRRRPAVFCLLQSAAICVAFLQIQTFAANHLYLLFPGVLLPVAAFWDRVLRWLGEGRRGRAAAIGLVTLLWLNGLQYLFPSGAVLAAPLRGGSQPGRA